MAIKTESLNFGNSSKILTAELPLSKSTISITDDILKRNSDLTKRLFSKNSFIANLSVTTENSICIDCKGAKLACGKIRCPILIKFESFKSFQEDISKKEIFGASPPAVFIGRIGYPNVSLGPMIPPETGNTSIYDVTEDWFGFSQRKIIELRMKLVRGKFKANVNKIHENNKFLDLTREIGLARSSIESEVSFTKAPLQKLKLDNNIQPMGPIATLKSLTLGSSKTNHAIEKCFTDTDLMANDAIISLSKKVNQTDITRAFSLGLFGLNKNRKLVPTRWSITAVDSALGIHYWKNVVQYPLINEVRIFESTYLGNRFIILMFPEGWGYELMEAWFPNSAWNPGNTIGMVSDYEGIAGRNTYAKIGGCYYSGRNIVGEYLNKEKKQARVVILRERYP
ncbi:MAG: hypothetical protein ACC656_08635, partial [Candidatus Heimdallarchaeota archaeon]